MDEDFLEGDLVARVRTRLNSDGVKLWLTPFVKDDGNLSSEDLNRLAQKYAEILSATPQLVEIVLQKLQSNALEKLAERAAFEKTGIATLRIRLPGVGMKRIETLLTSLACELKEKIASASNIPSTRLKLISAGHVLENNKDLCSQGVKNGSQIMAVVVAENSQAIVEIEARQNVLRATKSDAELLASKDHEVDDYYLNVTDQSGKPLDIPASERRSLVVAMTLHEKGRAALKKDDFSTALVLFLEADKEFRKCNSSILSAVDNYALLNLDIVWCYLRLQSITQIPEADQRLQSCEEKFRKSYGPNMERVLLIKGNAGSETALMVRLHLLQAIVKYHRGQREEARNMFHQVEKEISRLKVDDSKIAVLMGLGYSTAEARLGLRATDGDVETAVEVIVKKREEKEENLRKEREKKSQAREQRRFGKCANGEWVDVKSYKMLLAMGFNKKDATAALRQTNNDVQRSVTLLHEERHLLKDNTPDIKDEWVAQIMSLGFDQEMAMKALKKHKGNIDEAVADLLMHGGTVEFAGSDSEDEETSKEHMSEEQKIKQAEQREKEREAYERLAEGISTYDEDHLDITLVSEELILQHYLSLIEDKKDIGEASSGPTQMP